MTNKTVSAMRLSYLAAALCWLSIVQCVPFDMDWLSRRPIAEPKKAKIGWNETCIVDHDYKLDIPGFVDRCKHRGRLLSSGYNSGTCIHIEMSLFSEVQFNKVFRHASEILGLTLVFNNTGHGFLKLENLRWWHKQDETKACFRGEPANEEQCLAKRFYKSYENCEHVMIIENNRYLEHILIYSHTIEGLPHPDKEFFKDNGNPFPVVIRNNLKLDPPFIQKMAKLFRVSQWSDEFRSHEMCYPSVPLKKLSELIGCRHVLRDLIIDAQTKDDATLNGPKIKFIDGCLQVKDTTWDSLPFLNEGTKIFKKDGCLNATLGKTGLSGNQQMCVPYPLWYIFEPNISDNKAPELCETTPVKQNCKGRIITTLEDLLLLERCEVITGSLVIKGLQIKHGRHLRALNDIKKVEGRLTIRNCEVEHLMMASLMSVGARTKGVKISIRNIPNLKTVNLPSLWVGIDRGNDIQIKDCPGYRRPIHLGGVFDGQKDVTRHAVPLHQPKFPKKDTQLFYYTLNYLWPLPVGLALFLRLRQVWIHW